MDPKKLLLDTLRAEYILQKARYKGAQNAYETEYVEQFTQLAGVYKGHKFVVNFANNVVSVGVVESLKYTNYGGKDEITVYGRWILKNGKLSKGIQELFTDLHWRGGHVKKFTEGKV
jgi:hypothetical protein